MSRLAVVTGGNRGIGLRFCQKLPAKNYSIVTTCREPSPELEATGASIVKGVDVGVDGGCDPLTSYLAGLDRPVDLLVCNAGIFVEDKLDTLNIDAVQRHLEVNTLGPLRTVLAVKDRLARGAKVAVVSSRMGAISANTGGGGPFSGGLYGYRLSKAAANMLGVNLSIDLKDREISVAVLHPGFVATDMTAKYHGMPGVISPEECVDGLIRVIEDELRLDTSGTFWHSNGSVLTW